MLAGRQRQNARAGAAGRTPAGVWPARRREYDDAGRRGRHLDRGDGQRPRVARRRPPHVRPGGERYGRMRRAWLVRTRADGQRISVYLSTVSVVRPEAAAPGCVAGAGFTDEGVRCKQWYLGELRGMAVTATETQLTALLTAYAGQVKYAERDTVVTASTTQTGTGFFSPYSAYGWSGALQRAAAHTSFHPTVRSQGAPKTSQTLVPSPRRPSTCGSFICIIISLDFVAAHAGGVPWNLDRIDAHSGLDDTFNYTATGEGTTAMGAVDTERWTRACASPTRSSPTPTAPRAREPLWI